MKTLLIIITIHILLLSMVRFIAWPENLTWPYLNLHGLQYYKNIFVLYPPLYWEMLSGWYQMFGISVNSLKVISYIVIGLSDCLLWLAAGKKILPLFFYIPLQIFFEGNGIWVDHLLVPFFLGGYIFLQRRKYFLLGLCLGLAALTKQTAIYFALAIGLILLTKKTASRNIFLTLLGLIMTIGLLAVYLVFESALPSFYSSAINYILFFHSRYPLQTQWPTLRQALVTLLVFGPAILSQQKNRQLAALTLAASLGVFTRFEYFHLQPALPFLAILLSKNLLATPAYLLFLLLAARSIISGIGLSTLYFGPELLANAKTVQTFLKSGEGTVFINTWDQYYFLTGTLPVGNYFVPSTPWTMDYDGNQKIILNSLRIKKPRYIVMAECFVVKEICFRPSLLYDYVKGNYLERVKLPDGTGVFEYNPVGAR